MKSPWRDSLLEFLIAAGRRRSGADLPVRHWRLAQKPRRSRANGGATSTRAAACRACASLRISAYLSSRRNNNRRTTAFNRPLCTVRLRVPPGVFRRGMALNLLTGYRWVYGKSPLDSCGRRAFSPNPSRGMSFAVRPIAKHATRIPMASE